jgi:hypothetical protein
VFSILAQPSVAKDLNLKVSISICLSKKLFSPRMVSIDEKIGINPCFINSTGSHNPNVVSYICGHKRMLKVQSLEGTLTMLPIQKDENSSRYNIAKK